MTVQKFMKNKLLFPNVGFAPKDRTQTNNTEANKTPQQGQYQQNTQQYQRPSQANQPPVYYENAQGRPTPPPQRAMPDARSLPSIDIDEDSVPF